MPIITATIADPHVTNFKGNEFFFYGEHDECFCLLSATNMYLNVRLFDTNSKAPIMTEAGIIVGNEMVGIKKFFVSSLNTTMSYIIAQEHSEDIENLACDTIHRFDSGLVDRRGNPIEGSFKIFHDHVDVDTGNFKVKIYRCTDKEHNAVGPPHLDIYYEVGEIGVLSEGIWPHGIVGQSLDPDKTDNLQGDENDYKVSDIFARDFIYDCFSKRKVENKQWFIGVNKRSITM